jgi:hypothetical protein
LILGNDVLAYSDQPLLTIDAADVKLDYYRVHTRIQFVVIGQGAATSR